MAADHPLSINNNNNSNVVSPSSGVPFRTRRPTSPPVRKELMVKAISPVRVIFHALPDRCKCPFDSKNFAASDSAC
eukprot:9502080-Pyramimonas_sp.AAC.1